jgi:mRNA interferase HicA
VKRQELERRLTAIGCVIIRHGANHDLYQNPKTGAVQPLPRHAEIKDFLARAIIRRLSAP